MQVSGLLATLRKARLRECLQEWQDAARWRVRMTGICRRMVARMQHRYLAVCMGQWQEAALQGRHMRWYSSPPDLSTAFARSAGMSQL